MIDFHFRYRQVFGSLLEGIPRGLCDALGCSSVRPSLRRQEIEPQFAIDLILSPLNNVPVSYAS
jgi:hypothetical protein